MQEIAQMNTQRRREMFDQIEDVMRSFGVSDRGMAEFWTASASGAAAQNKVLLDAC